MAVHCWSASSPETLDPRSSGTRTGWHWIDCPIGEYEFTDLFGNSCGDDDGDAASAADDDDAENSPFPNFLMYYHVFSYRLINQDRQLEIIAMQPSDAGRYRCVAKNPFGQLEINTDLTVGGESSWCATPCRTLRD